MHLKNNFISRLLHPTTLVVHPDYKNLREFVTSIPERFERGEGKVIHKGRNELRDMEYGGEHFVVKSFHCPHLLNRFVYGTFRASKAKRSYEHALIYLGIGVGTPSPVGYINVRKGILFDKSFYVTRLSSCPYTYDQLFFRKFDYADDVLRAIGHATAILHEHGYAHKDYGRGNILFGQVEDGSVRIEVVDLNRMHIGHVGLKAGCKNFERLPATPHMHQVMAEAYAEVRHFDARHCCELMAAYRSVQPGKIDGKY